MVKLLLVFNRGALLWGSGLGASIGALVFGYSYWVGWGDTAAVGILLVALYSLHYAVLQGLELHRENEQFYHATWRQLGKRRVSVAAIKWETALRRQWEFDGGLQERRYRLPIILHLPS